MGLSLILSIALSIDGFFVGVAYGIRRIRLPLSSMLVVAMCTAGGMSLSLFIGETASGLFSFQATKLIGAIFLGVLGLIQLVQGWQEYSRVNSDGKPSIIIRLRIKALGLVIQLLRDPQFADTDRSGVIDAKEAFTLGVALGIDALVAGFAAALLEYNPVLLVGLVTFGLLILMNLGVLLGKRFGNRISKGKGVFLPGLLICLIAIIQLKNSVL